MRTRNPIFSVSKLNLVLIPLLLASCVSSHLERDKVVIERDVKTYLEHRVTEDKIVEQGYAHPYSFAVEELTMLLKSMHYQEPKLFSDPETVPVFQPAEAERLARAIAPALGTANSRQRVRFVSFNTAGWGILNAKRKTEGVCFMEEGKKLNIAFITINDKQDPREAGQPDPYLSYVNPLNIRSAHCPLIPTDWSEIHQDTEDPSKQNPLWLVVDVEAAREWFKDRGADVRSVFQPVRTGEKTATPATVAIEPEQIQAGEVIEDTEQPAAPELKQDAEIEQGDAKTASGEGPDKLKTDLQKLKQYFEEGLITEEEYKAKKAELLEKF